MSKSGSNSLLSNDEIEAALAEIEALSPDKAGAIPNLDDGTGESEETVHYVPVGASQSPVRSRGSQDKPLGQCVALHTAAQPQAEPESAETARPRSALRLPWPGLGWLRSLLRLGRRKHAVSQASDTPSSAETSAKDGVTNAAPEAGGDSAAQGSWGARLYELLDAMLEIPSRPFRPRARGTIGPVAIVTIVMSVLAVVFIPLACPNRNAYTFLQERHAELQMADTGDAGAEEPTKSP